MSSDIYFKNLFSNHLQPPSYNVIINQYVYKCVSMFSNELSGFQDKYTKNYRYVIFMNINAAVIIKKMST